MGFLNFTVTIVLSCRLVIEWTCRQWKNLIRRTRERHDFFVLPELGEDHPQICLMDGVKVATRATYIKVLMTKTICDKLAFTFYHPKKSAVRYSLNNEFFDEIGKQKLMLNQMISWLNKIRGIAILLVGIYFIWIA